MLLKTGMHGSVLRSFNITQTRRRQSRKGRKFKQMRLCAHFHARSIHFICFFNNVGHGRKFKQMRLCADFNAGPSKVGGAQRAQAYANLSLSLSLSLSQILSLKLEGLKWPL